MIISVFNIKHDSCFISISKLSLNFLYKKKGNKKEHCYKIHKILYRVIHIIYDGSQFLMTSILL